MIDFKVGVILPAAGSGERLGGPTPKQYCKVLDKPLLMYALESFENIPFVRSIALVVDSPVNVEALLRESHCQKVLVVQGESSRHRSIKVGLQALTKKDSELRVVIVHDAVRPIVPLSLLEQLVKAADENGAAGAVCPLVSTVLKTRDDGLLQSSLDRKTHLASETPQAFQMSVLVSAYNKCSDEDLDCGTECLQLALSYSGVHARLIKGSPEDLWKVTFKRDLHTATECLREYTNAICIMAREECNATKILAEGLAPYAHLVDVMITNSKKDFQRSAGCRFNNVIFFHASQIDMESPLLNFATLLDLEKQGLIIHIMEQGNVEELQSMTAYDLQSSGRRMAHQYHKLKKGVIVIHHSDSDPGNLLTLIITLLKAHPLSLTGQTFFL